MSDAELRALEREVAALDSVATRVRLALALERSGRADEAWDVLRPVREDALARPHAAREPAWAHPDGGESGGGFIDARPLARAPRVSWVAPVPLALRPGFVLANAFAIVVGGHGGYALLEPRSGRVRLSVPGGEALALAGDRLVAREGGEDVARDLVTGRPVPGRVALPRSLEPLAPPLVARGPGIEVRSGRPGELVLVAADSPRSLGRGDGAVAIARDTVYFGGEGTIAGARASRETVFRVGLAPLRRARLLALAATQGRLLGLTSGARVFCLEET